MTHTQWTAAGERHRAMTSSHAERKLRDHVTHRTVIPIIDGRTHAQSAIGIDGRPTSLNRVTFLPLRHVHTSLPALFRNYEPKPARTDDVINQRSTDVIPPRPNSIRRRYCADSEIGEISRRLRNTAIGERRARVDEESHYPVIERKRSGVKHVTYSTKPSSSSSKHSSRPEPELPESRVARSETLPLPINPILKRHPEVDSSLRARRRTAKRRACFKQEVDICYFNVKDRPQTTVCMPRQSKNITCGAYIVTDPEGEKIHKAEPERAKQQFKHPEPDLESPKHHSKSLAADPESGIESRLPTRVILPNEPDVQTDGRVDPEHGIACNTSVRIIPCVDGKGNKGHLLRLDLRASCRCIRERTLVKALSGGGAVIVHLFQNEAAEDGGSAVLRQHVKKISLPVNIDPYRVRAHIHKDGLLTIEAPVMDCSLPKI